MAGKFNGGRPRSTWNDEVLEGLEKKGKHEMKQPK